MHLTEKQFKQLYDDSLDIEQVETLFEHAEGCQACLDRMDRWLENQSVVLALRDETVVPGEFRQKLVRRINREEATRTIVRFSFDGFVRVFVFLLGSIIGINSNKRPSIDRDVRVNKM